MKREIIDLNVSNITFGESDKLIDYIWQGDLLIPNEMLGD